MSTTPVFGIRGPDGTTKAKDLPATLTQQNLDIEAALLLAQVPPSVPANIYVAPTEAARNLRFGAPASAAARLALQNSGALCIRSDLGYTERYYAGLTDGGTNPGGVLTPGWYPCDGAMPAGFFTVGTFNVPNGTETEINSGWTTVFDAHGFRGASGAAASRFTPKIPGWYRVTLKSGWPNNANGGRLVTARCSAATQTVDHVLQDSRPAYAVGNGRAQVSGLLEMTGTNYIYAQHWQDSGGALNWNGSLLIEFVRPRGR